MTVPLFLLCLLALAFLFILIFTVTRKLQTVYSAEHTHEEKEAIKSSIEKFLPGTEREFNEGLEEFVRHAPGMTGKYRTVSDEYLLNALELPGAENRERLIAIARRLDFPSECRTQIKNRNPRISALGARRAGLYKLAELENDMVAALDVLSSENQFEILMALARIGGAEAMGRAFEKIKSNVIINERAVIEILSEFPRGEEKLNLFRNMIHRDMDYLTALFLKAADPRMTKILMDDIIKLLHNDNKEIRAAAVRSLATLGADAPADELVRAMEDSDWEIRALAAKALYPILTPEAGNALYKALFDQQWWVRQNAANSLVKHPGYEVLFILAAESGDEYTRDSIISALENGGGSPLLLRAIKIMSA